MAPDARPGEVPAVLEVAMFVPFARAQEAVTGSFGPLPGVPGFLLLRS